MPSDPDRLVKGGNLTDGLPSKAQAEEVFELLGGADGVRVERIVSTGQATPDGEWYDQDWDEFVVLVSGAARVHIEGEDEDRSLTPGDWLLLPAHCRHRVTWTQEAPAAVWLAVHFGGPDRDT